MLGLVLADVFWSPVFGAASYERFIVAINIQESRAVSRMHLAHLPRNILHTCVRSTPLGLPEASTAAHGLEPVNMNQRSYLALCDAELEKRRSWLKVRDAGSKEMLGITSLDCCQGFKSLVFSGRPAEGL